MSFSVDNGQLMKGLDYLKLSVLASALNNGSAEAATARATLMRNPDEFVRTYSSSMEATNLGDLSREIRQVLVHAPSSQESALSNLAKQSETMAKRLFGPCIGSFAFIISGLATGLNDGSAASYRDLKSVYADGEAFSRDKARLIGDVAERSTVSEDMDYHPPIEQLAAGTHMHDILRLANLNQPLDSRHVFEGALSKTQRCFSGE